MLGSLLKVERYEQPKKRTCWLCKKMLYNHIVYILQKEISFSNFLWALYSIVKLLVLYCILHDTYTLIFLLNVCINIFTLHLTTLLLKYFHLLLFSLKTCIVWKMVTDWAHACLFLLCCKCQPACLVWETRQRSGFERPMQRSEVA